MRVRCECHRRDDRRHPGLERPVTAVTPATTAPGPVRVTIRAAVAPGSRRGLADMIREIAAERSAPAASLDGRQKTCAPKRRPGWTRTPSGTGNWTPLSRVQTLASPADCSAGSTD